MKIKLLAILLTISSVCFAQEGDEFKKEVERYLQITKAFDKMENLILVTFKAIPEYKVNSGSEQERIIIEILRESYPEILKIYSKYMSTVIQLDELNKINTFLESEDGQMFLKFSNDVQSVSQPIMIDYAEVLRRLILKNREYVIE